MEETESKQKGISSKASFTLGLITGLVIFGFVGFVMVYSLVKEDARISSLPQSPVFADTGEPVCTESGKPIIRLFSLSTCPHCAWVKPTYERVAREYADAGKIIAYNWEVDTNDNTLTVETEGEVPAGELELYTKFNPEGYVPEFIFGCKYLRIGNSFEAEGDLVREEAELRRVIEEVLK